MDTLDSTTFKYCPKCQTSHPATAEYFHLNSRSKDGFAYRCKECAKQTTREWNAANSDRVHANSKRWRETNPDLAKAKYKEWYEANRERLLPKFRENGREWYQANKERRHETAQAWRKANPDRRKAKDREWALANPDRMRAYSKKWRQDHPDKVREGDHRRRARLQNAPGSHTADDLIAIRAAQTDAKGRLICWECGKPIKGTPHLDHWIPLDKDGTNYAGNLHYMHAKCNLSKGAKHPHDMGRLI